MSSKLDLIEDVLNDSDITVDDVKQLTEKLNSIKDIVALSGREEQNAIIEKWNKKVSPFLSDEDKKNLAFMLNNYHNYSKNTMVQPAIPMEERNFKEELEVINSQIDFINSELKKTEISTAKRKLLNNNLNQLNKTLNLTKKEQHEQDPFNTFPLRGINIMDEIVKAYDLINMREVVGTQVMNNPLGLAYALRQRANNPMEEITTASFKPLEETKEVGLTIEQKEIKASSFAMNIPEGKKLSAELIASNINALIFNSIDKLTKENIIELTNPDEEEVYNNMEMHQKDIATTTRMGKANKIICSKTLLKKYKTIIEKLDLKPVITNLIPDDQYILAYRGEKESDCGIVWSPYVMVVLPMVTPKTTINKVVTRNSIKDDLFGTSNYYMRFKLKEEENPSV